MKLEMTVIKDDILSLVSGGTTAALGEPKYMPGDRVWFIGTGTAVVQIIGTVRGTTGEYVAGQLMYEVEAGGILYIQPENTLTQITVSHEGGAGGGW